MCEHELTEAQARWLLQPIEPHRISKLPSGSRASYVAQHDIRAHLTRIFGFTGWSMEVLETRQVFEEQRPVRDSDPPRQNWVACYTATVRITIFCSLCGDTKASYSDSNADESAPQPARGDAHALALTSAVSTAMKRAASCLGDQFGLSLYNHGQTTAFVRGTLVGPLQAGAVQTVEVHGLGGEDEATSESTSHDGTRPPALSETGQALLVRLEEVLEEGPVPGKRVAVVAGLKRQYAQVLDEPLLWRDQTITLGRLADLVASGAVLYPVGSDA